MGDATTAFERSGLHRFFVAAGSVHAERVEFTAAQKQQLRKVLRLQVGDRVIALTGDGAEIVVSLQEGADGVYGALLSRHAGIPEPARRVWLYQSALRGDRFTWLLQKATELGAAGIVPLLCRYTQQADYLSRSDRYAAVVREAAEQCRRSALPAVLAAMPFSRAARHARALTGAHCFLLDEHERSTPLRAALPDVPEATVCLFVGPEGGLAPEERAEAVQLGLLPATLGPRILRSETAGLTALTLALAASGDLD